MPAFLFMRPDIVTIGNVSPDWRQAIERDIAAGIVPQWIGAIVVSSNYQGLMSVAFIERWKWVQSKVSQAIAKN